MGTLKRGKSKHRPRYAFNLYGGPYPFIQTGEIREASKYITKYEQTYSEAGLAQSKLWHKGTLCITIAANIAEVAILSFDACFPDSVLGFIPDGSKCDLDFAYYTLKYFQRELQQMGDGSVQDNINLGTFEQIKFPFPPLKEQIAVAAILSSLDDKIDLLHRQNETLEASAETMFRQRFIEEADDSWEEIVLKDIMEVKGGFSYNGKFIGSGDAILLGMGCVSFSERFLHSGARSYCGECPNKYLVKPGDIVIATRQQSDNLPILGYPAIVPQEYEGRNVIVGANLYRVINNSTLHNYVIYLLLKSVPYRTHIIASSKGTTVRMITKDAIETFSFRMPPTEKVKEFQKFIEPINEKIDKISTQIKTLTQLRDTLLPKLMSREVRVKL